MTLSTEIRAAFIRNLSCKTLAFCHNKLCMCVPVDSCRTKIITNAVFVLKEKGFSFAHIILYQFPLYWHTSPTTKSFSAQSERLHQFAFIPKTSIFAFVCIFVFAHAPAWYGAVHRRFCTDCKTDYIVRSHISSILKRTMVYFVVSAHYEWIARAKVFASNWTKKIRWAIQLNHFRRKSIRRWRAFLGPR